MIAVAAKRQKRFSALWAVLLVVIGFCLAVGAGAIGSDNAKAPSLYQRTLQVAGEYRCPVCAGESAAVSDAPEAVEIRQLIQRSLQQGDSQAQIQALLVHDYGVSILEKPPASGLSALVWILPVAAGVFAVIGLGLGFARWRRASLLGPMAVQERLFDVAVVEMTEKKPARRLSQRVTFAAGAALVLVAGALWLVDRSSSERLPGVTITGGLSGVNAELEEASSLTATDPTEALALYDEVLAGDPGQPVALTAEGWIYAQAGIVPKAMGLLERAERADPSYDLPHLYSAFVLLDDEGEVAAAVRELNWYLAHGPDPTMVQVAKAALAQARGSAKKLPPER